MTQYIIKDGRGKAVQSRSGFPNYTNVAREIMSVSMVLPFTVWRHDTIHGVQSYDGPRTRKFSDAVRLVLARRIAAEGSQS